METKTTWIVSICEPEQYLESDNACIGGITVNMDSHTDAMSMASQMTLHGMVCIVRGVD